MKKMLITGQYNSEYQRNKVLIEAFEGRFVVAEKNLNNIGKISIFKSLYNNAKKNDYILLLQPAHKFVLEILFLKIIFPSKKIIYDAFTSIYDSFINDRKLAGKISVKALYYYLLDYLMCKFSDILIFDTYSHQEYFKNTFKISKNKKTLVLPVTVDVEKYDEITPRADIEALYKNEKFNIFFYGYYIPLQGVDYIIKAANLLKDNNNIHFTLVGSGQTRKEIDSLYKKLKLDNITFIDRIPFDELIMHIKCADVCLGIFGDTEKAQRVIPNKVLDYMACGKIAISGRSEEMERYFENNKEILYCNFADEKDLAEKILYVCDNYDKLNYIKDNVRISLINKFSKEDLSKKIEENIVK